jgi:hypothetical protein
VLGIREDPELFVEKEGDGDSLVVGSLYVFV